MQSKLIVNSYWMRKVAVFLAFLSVLSARDVQALGLPPLISVPPVGLSVHNGDTATLTATIGVSLTTLTIKWYCNGVEVPNANVSNLKVPILGTTISTLTIPHASAAQAGNYYIKAENLGGSVTSGNALLIVLDTTVSNLLSTVNLLTSQCGMTNGGFLLNLLKPAGSNCVIEATTDFKNWVPIHTNTSGSTNISFVDTAATSLRTRYYRARLQ